MDSKTEKLADALRNAAGRLESGDRYEWGHMGSCNCGHLAQQLTQLDRDTIHRYAMEKHGDWADQVLDFCPDSGLTMDLLISELTSYGLTTRDLIDLERLSNEEILRSVGRASLRKNEREDVALYMRTWAGMLNPASEEPVPV